MQEDPTIACWEGFHLRIAAFISVLNGVVMWGCCFPLGLGYILKLNLARISKRASVLVEVKTGRKQFEKLPPVSVEEGGSVSNRLQNEAAPAGPAEEEASGKMRIFAFFYKGYQEKYFYWESLIFMRKCFLICFAAMHQSLPAESSRIILVAIFMALFYYTTKLKPFQSGLCNRIDSLSLFVCAFTVFISGLTDSGISYTDKSVFFSFCALVNMGFYGTVVGAILSDVYRQMKTRRTEDTSRRMPETLKTRKVVVP